MTVYVKATASYPVCLDTGRILAAGETADVDPDANRDLLDHGDLTPVQGPPAPTKTRKTAAEES